MSGIFAVRGFETPRSLALLKTLDLFYSLRVLRVLPPAANIVITHTFWLPFFRSVPITMVSSTFTSPRYPKGQMRFYGHAARLQTVSQPIKEAIIAEAPRCRERVTMHLQSSAGGHL